MNRLRYKTAVMKLRDFLRKYDDAVGIKFEKKNSVGKLCEVDRYQNSR